MTKAGTETGQRPTDSDMYAPKSFRIIMSAYACEPHSSSEPCAGWNYALQAARHGNEVQQQDRQLIQRYQPVRQARGQVSGVQG